ncbi:sugar-binding domain-containing protein [Bifidobacterium sp. ESL0745]|uniref:sugar-binding transcriptional regulator n=1 Tax=Bifidobacterium sp. ESL0745 TaxID=2983226 RepID=UPI0023F7DA95|nr:sugar-binding domain-containing protein [Bifidobacterium sp. ESL0745]MDF7664643.1 sugar-binding domain-containing protein [Bifidobacterium sp. ESL0745]
MNDNDDVQRSRVADAAELYWVQGMKAGAVARELGVSRSTVSRLLTQARTQRVIEFKVNRHSDSTVALQQEINKRYRVYASVVDTGGIHDPDTRRMIVGETAATLLSSMVHSNTMIGVTWGRTTEAIAMQLIPKNLSDVQVLPLHGFGNTLSLGEDYFTQILIRFGKAFNAQVRLLPAPVIFDSEITREMVWKETGIQQILALRKYLDIIVTSVGTPYGYKRSPLFSKGVLSDQDIKELNDKHVIGDISSTFFREDGSTQGISVNKRSTGLTREEILRVPNRVFVVSDENKYSALRTALNMKAVTHLVIDQATAKRLLET